MQLFCAITWSYSIAFKAHNDEIVGHRCATHSTAARCLHELGFRLCSFPSVMQRLGNHSMMSFCSFKGFMDGSFLWVYASDEDLGSEAVDGLLLLTVLLAVRGKLTGYHGHYRLLPLCKLQLSSKFTLYKQKIGSSSPLIPEMAGQKDFLGLGTIPSTDFLKQCFISPIPANKTNSSHRVN